MFGLKTYYKKEKIKIDLQLLDYRQQMLEEKTKLKNDLYNLAVTCANQTKEYEHEFHSKREELGIEIAKLEEKKNGLLNEIAIYQKILSHKPE